MPRLFSLFFTSFWVLYFHIFCIIHFHIFCILHFHISCILHFHIFTSLHLYIFTSFAFLKYCILNFSLLSFLLCNMHLTILPNYGLKTVEKIFFVKINLERNPSTQSQDSCLIMKVPILDKACANEYAPNYKSSASHSFFVCKNKTIFVTEFPKKD